MKVDDSVIDSLELREIPQRSYSKDNVFPIRDQLTSKLVRPLIQETENCRSKITPRTNFSTLLQELFGPVIDEVFSLGSLHASIENKKRIHQLKSDLEEAQRWIQVLLKRLPENEVSPESDSRLTRILHRVLNIK